MPPEMSRGSRRDSGRDLVVRNVSLTARLALASVIFLVPGILYGLPGVFHGPAFLGALAFVFGAGLALMCRAQASGIVISSHRNVVEFFGGGISANSLLDYFRWSWLTQHFRRFCAPLDEVTSLEQFSKSGVKNGRRYTRHFVRATFASGVVTWAFENNEAKADQLMQIVRVVNRMGTNAVFEA